MLDTNNSSNGLAPHKKPSKEQDNAPLFVSLYIVLLAFFIMLNSISKVSEDKVESAVNSISDAFDLRHSLIHVPPVMNSLGTEIAVINVFGRMEKLTKSFIPLEDIEVAISGNVMEMTLPTSEFFLNGQYKIRQKMQPFFAKMSELVLNSEYADGLELEVIVPLPVHELVNASVKEHKLSYHRASQIITNMIKLQLPARKLSAAVRSSPSNKFVIRFVQRLPERSRLIISQPEGVTNGK